MTTNQVRMQFWSRLEGQQLSVRLEGTRRGQPFAKKEISLVMPSELAAQLAQWHTHYRQLGETTRIRNVQGDVLGTIQQRKDRCQQTSQALRSCFLDWLDGSEFRTLSDELRDEFPKDESVQVFLQSDDPRLEDLPWHEWDFLARRTQAAYVLSPPAFRKVMPSRLSSQQRRRILVILGKSDGINTQRDVGLFQGLPGNPIVEVFPQQCSQVLRDTLWEKAWDIMVFAGHSETRPADGKGILHLNDEESITFDELWLALRKAVDRGLQLVIFNSCDGLGIARQLDDDLAIPQMVVMKELVPDAIAHDFLSYLLHALTQENLPLYLAVREAQQRLQDQEKDYPCASWLPVLWQNPVAEPFVWAPDPPRRLSSPRLPWQRVLATSLAVTCLVMGIRWLGWLQAAELAAFDRFMHPSANPSHLESPDQRILLIEITESDIQNYGFPVPDGVLAQLLDRLQHYQPQVIGLNLWRDIPQQPGHEVLMQQFQQNDRLIAVCQFPNLPQGQAEIPPPARLLRDQVGFNNFITDELSGSRDDTIRRYLFSRTSNGDEGLSSCNTEYSFAFQLAFQYLQARGVEVKVQANNNWQFGSRTSLPLKARSGGYQNIDARGYQLLINYRRAANIARSLTLADVLTRPLDPALVKGKLVMIGVTAESGKDYWRTPFPKKMSGLHLQAHAVSQILSAVEDQRPLMGWLPAWIDALLIWTFSLIGGSFVWFGRISPLHLGVIVALSIVMVYTLCRIGFSQGLWLPFIPLELALVGSMVGLVAHVRLQLRSSNRPLPRHPQ